MEVAPRLLRYNIRPFRRLLEEQAKGCQHGRGTATLSHLSPDSSTPSRLFCLWRSMNLSPRRLLLAPKFRLLLPTPQPLLAVPDFRFYREGLPSSTTFSLSSLGGPRICLDPDSRQLRLGLSPFGGSRASASSLLASARAGLDPTLPVSAHASLDSTPALGPGSTILTAVGSRAPNSQLPLGFPDN